MSSANHHPSSLTALGGLLATVREHEGRRFVWGLILTLALGAASALTVALLVPLLQAAGVGVAGSSAESPPLFRFIVGLTGPAPSLAGSVVAYVLVIALYGALRWAEARIANGVTQGVAVALRRRLFRLVCTVEWGSYTRDRSSDVLQTLTTEIDRIGHAAGSLLSLTSASIITAVYLLISLAVSIPMTVVIVLTGSVLALMLRGLRRQASAVGTEYTETSRRVYGSLSESLASMKTIRSHGAAAQRMAEFDTAAEDLYAVTDRIVRANAASRLSFDVGAAAALGLFTYVAFAYLALPISELFVLLFLFLRLAPQLSGVHYHYQALGGQLPAFSAVSAFETHYRQARAPMATAVGRIEMKRAIELRDITFAYGDEPVLRNLDMRLPAGATTALVGASGAGKTTLADLVLGLLTPQQGAVLIDDQLLAADTLSSWQAQIGYVPQESVLFHNTIRANLTWVKPGATERDLGVALERAAAEFVWRLPDGVDTLVGDRGVLLSGGERQRLALARALLREPALLVLDEATNALDADNEKRIIDAVAGLRGRTTVLLIAHRLSTVRHADVIHVLDSGRIVETGSWDDLIQRPGGHFQRIYAGQNLAAM